MITLKLWNSMSQSSRSFICKILGVSGEIEQQYFHNFDHDKHGARLKILLENCNLQKDGTTKIIRSFIPEIENATRQKKQSKKSVKASEYINAINSSFRDACRILNDLLKHYGGKSFYLSVDTDMGWNHHVVGFGISKNKTYADIYWQGDSTDGNDAVHVDDFLTRDTIVIPASSYFDGERTRYTHSDLRITREEIYTAMKKLTITLQNAL